MSLRSKLDALDRLQRGRRFKQFASILLALLTLGAAGALFVAGQRPGAQDVIIQRIIDRANAHRENPGARTDALETLASAYDNLLSLAGDPTGVATIMTVAGAILAALLAIVWLGLGLTYFCFIAAALAVAAPLFLFEPTHTLGLFALGLIPLTFEFLILSRLVRLLFSARSQTLAVARNVLHEAVRMKISLVFIVLIIIVLALVPTLLSDDQPLRFRVQQWLQYGAGICYGLLALLTAFFACATVAFEQRDRVIWQTMSKPVPAWRYLLGKWIGVMGLNAVLLTVVATGAYMFTEFLRHQPAKGEIAHHVRDDGTLTAGAVDQMTLDRRILETQVLVARVKRDFEPVVLDPQEVAEEVERRIRELRQGDPGLRVTDEVRNHLFAEVSKERSEQHRTVEPGQGRMYTFTGLGPVRDDWIRRITAYEKRIARDMDRLIRRDGEDPEIVRQDAAEAERYRRRVEQRYVERGQRPIQPTLTLQFKINSGTNNPSSIFTLDVVASHPTIYAERIRAALKQRQYTEFGVNAIDADGVLRLFVSSPSEPSPQNPGLLVPLNPASFTFPPDGLQILYAKGGYTANFVRIMAVMWIKLGFIAAVGILCATGLSFAVSCLGTLGLLFAAESSQFLAESLDFYFVPARGELDLGARLIQAVGKPIVWTFDTYASLRPTQSLVDGLLLSWRDLGMGVVVIGVWTSIALAGGILIFRRRELALYSGH